MLRSFAYSRIRQLQFFRFLIYQHRLSSQSLNIENHFIYSGTLYLFSTSVVRLLINSRKFPTEAANLAKAGEV